jgi:hypothetical protein
VHKHTLQHVRYPDVWSLGDCEQPAHVAHRRGDPQAGAGAGREPPRVARGPPLTGSYDGYASCPLVTGYGKLILAEFDYDGNPAESFPFDQSRGALLDVRPQGLRALPSSTGTGCSAAARERSTPGPLEAAIVSVAREVDACVLVMATRGHDGLRDATLGSHTERVLREVQCPVLSVPIPRS